MRHSTITLTYDRYGHLFPGQEADAVSQLADVMSAPVAAAATGTDGAGSIYAHGYDSAPMITGNPSSHPPTRKAGAQQQAQQSGRETVRSQCETVQTDKDCTTDCKSPNPLRLTEIDDTLRITATECDAAAPLAQLAEQLTLNQFEYAKTSEKNRGSENSAAQGAAHVTPQRAIDSDLAKVVELWPELPPVVKSGILAMVEATRDR